MKLIISGKNITVTDTLRDRISKKLSKLDKFFSPFTEAHATLSVIKNRSADKTSQILEVTILYNGILFRAEATNEDMYNCVDRVIEILEGQIRKNKTKLEKKLRLEAFEEDDSDLEFPVEEEQEFKVVRTKRFAIKPMTVDEAILQMNLLGHTFFMFSNAETSEANVVYKRKDGNYGLIEPEFI